jgi:fructose-specific phosphotransferase system IIC component
VQPTAPPDAIAITPVVRTGIQQPAREVGMIDVAVAAFGLTGAIMVAALVAGLLAGVGFVWFRKRHAVTTIEARGHNHNFLRY